MVNEKDCTKKLHAEGFRYVYIWQDAPNASYPDHTHPETTAHVVLEGEMTVTYAGQTRTYKPGERFDVPAHAVHAARVGTQGCKYIIGEQ
ncbi:MAG: cupin domain-containing protein [Acidobacteriia bacterium]|nr:cupin domain-containing protein [Terriglobia bacterium]